MKTGKCNYDSTGIPYGLYFEGLMIQGQQCIFVTNMPAWQQKANCKGMVN